MTNNTAPVRRNIPRTAFVTTFWSFFFALCLIYGSLLALEPRTYSSNASLEILPHATNLPPMIHLDSPGRPPRWLSAELDFMQSPAVLNSVIEQLQLDRKWGNKYNNGTPLSTKESFYMLAGRISLGGFRHTPLIEIRAYSADPTESAQIANSIMQSYRSRVISEHHPVSVRILGMARTPPKAIRPNIPFGMMWTFIRALIFALLTAIIARGIAIGMLQMKRNPPPTAPTPAASSEEKLLPRFQKY